MWKLKSVKKEHVEYHIFVGEDCVVGRKDATLLLASDPSVSRKHAVLYVKHPEENLKDPTKKPSLFLRDEGSKYGTFKNGARLTTEVDLEDGDIVKFGQFESEFRVCALPLIVTTSCLEVSAKRMLKIIVHNLGGHFVPEWQPSCTHLVMSEVKVTVKALCCLVSAKPIVQPEYFEELKKSLHSTSTVISPNNFVPPIGESLIDQDKVSFGVNLQRKQIFENRTFFFLDEKQFKKLHLGIMLGSGNATILSDEEIDEELLLRDGHCVIEPSREMSQNAEINKLMEQVKSILLKKKLRMIPESDIGLAVAYCSTEKYCNPKFSFGAAVLRSPKVQSQTLSQGEVYVPNTEELVAGLSSPPPRGKLINPTAKHFAECPSSLSLKCQDENMDVSEIPLSAKIKQELDDIFEVPMQTEAADVQITETVLGCSSRKTKKTGLKNRSEDPEMVEIHSDEECQADENPPPVVFSKVFNPPKKEKDHTAIGDNKPFESMVSANAEPELPRNLMKIQIVSLICKKKLSVFLQQNQKTGVKNFKKFKKVHPVKAQVLPRIIGSHELVPYDKNSLRVSNIDWDEPQQEEVFQPVKGEFDWETPVN